MKIEEQKFLEHASENFKNAIDVAILVENGDIELSIEGLLRCYAILKKWYTCYETKSELHLLNEDVAILSCCETFMSILSSHIEDLRRYLLILKLKSSDILKQTVRHFQNSKRQMP